MATYVQPRQPFAALDGSRLQALGSIKNRQNGMPELLRLQLDSRIYIS
jgi:hypothetical protein